MGDIYARFHMFEQNNKSVEIRKMLLKALGKSVPPYYYSLSVNYAKKLLKLDNKSIVETIKIKPSKTLAIV